jgi:phage terminase large subunit
VTVLESNLTEDKTKVEMTPKWGTWVNPEISQIIRRRLRLAAEAEKSKALQQQILNMCREDPVRWINDWVWTSDPRNLDYESPTTVPMILFPNQVDYVHWRQKQRKSRKGGIVEKTRDAGATWLNVCTQVHSWLFEPGYKGTFASRKESLVDRRGDPDSIFSKIRQILQYLPPWMIPSDYEDHYMKLVNLDNGSSITGEAGDNIGRGGRSSLVDVDEASFIEHPLLVDAALSQNTKVIFYTSTPNGTGNPFYNKRFSGVWDVFTFYWRDDPRKDDAWYEEQKLKLDDVTLAQEIDISYSASLEGAIIQGKWVEPCVNHFDPTQNLQGTRQAGLDLAGSGKNKSVLVIMQSNVVIAIYDWQGLDPTEVIQKAIPLCQDYGIKHLNYDATGLGQGVGTILKQTERLGFTYTPVHNGGSPSDLFWQDENISSKQKFANLRAESWWLLAVRFRKTFEHVNLIRQHPPEERISILRHPDLLTQLTSVTVKTNSEKKILLESKDEMKSKGITSPDFADALVLANYPAITAEGRYKKTVARSGRLKGTSGSMLLR